MIYAVWFASIVLALTALADKRARPLLLVMAVIAMLGIARDLTIHDRALALAMKVPFDLWGGFMACQVITHRSKRWELAVPALFSLTMIAHAAYWLAYFNGVSIWGIYAHTLNALFLTQLFALCWPSGGKLIGSFASWARGVVAGQRRALGAFDEAARAEAASDDASFDQRGGRDDVFGHRNRCLSPHRKPA